MINFSSFSISESELKIKFVRSSGAGGQNVNKVSTKAELRWNVVKSKDLPYSIKQRFLRKWSKRVSLKGEIVLTSDQSRYRLRNHEIVLDRLRLMIDTVISPPKKRIKKKPTKASIERRLKEKKIRSDLKRNRRSPRDGN